MKLIHYTKLRSEMVLAKRQLRLGGLRGEARLRSNLPAIAEYRPEFRLGCGVPVHFAIDAALYESIRPDVWHTLL